MRGRYTHHKVLSLTCSLLSSQAIILMNAAFALLRRVFATMGIDFWDYPSSACSFRHFIPTLGLAQPISHRQYFSAYRYYWNFPVVVVVRVSGTKYTTIFLQISTTLIQYLLLALYVAALSSLVLRALLQFPLQYNIEHTLSNSIIQREDYNSGMFLFACCWNCSKDNFKLSFHKESILLKFKYFIANLCTSTLTLV